MNCKPGDLAYVVHAKVQENLGKVVEIIRFLPAGEWQAPDGGFYLTGDTGAWLVSAGNGVIMSRYEGYGRLQAEKYGVYPDSSLRPINGGSLTEEICDSVPA